MKERVLSQRSATSPPSQPPSHSETGPFRYRVVPPRSNLLCWESTRCLCAFYHPMGQWRTSTRPLFLTVACLHRSDTSPRYSRSGSRSSYEGKQYPTELCAYRGNLDLILRRYETATSHSLATSSSYRRSPYAAPMSVSSAVTPKGPWMHPSPHLTHLDAFRRCINRKYGLNLTNYTQLHKWSVDEIESFCREIWTFCGLVYTKPPTAVAVGIESMWPRPRWFPGARLNYTENILIKGLAAHPDAVAVSACREGGTQWRHLTWIELRRQVALYTSALRHAGVKQGDRVATVATNSIESLLILLAAGAVGAIFSSTAPDMGAKGIVERYSQIQPKVLFLESTVLYGGKTQDQREKLKTAVGELKKQVKQLERVVIMTGPAWEDTSVLHLNDFLNVELLPLEFTQLPFDHPIYILYSSGTTGPPKCICHAGGAVLLQQKKDLILGADLGEDSTYYQYTTLVAPTLGMQVEIWDQDGRNIENSGQKEDLVITKPFFSMPVTFWGEGGHEKYRKAYFDIFPGIWCHGDFISKDLKTQGYVIHGRSDGVLNPGGVRFGTADLYNIVYKFPQVEDCIAVGQRRPKDNDERVLLFLKMRDNTRLEDSLRADIAKAIRKDLSGRHIPAYIFQVRDIP
ncbi:acetoacetate-CoA ligase [Ilyonectria robusta]